MENNLKLFFYLGGAILIPYFYLFTIRPKLLKFESKMDDKITDISDKELQAMKIKLEAMRNKKKD